MGAKVRKYRYVFELIRQNNKDVCSFGGELANIINLYILTNLIS